MTICPNQFVNYAPTNWWTSICFVSKFWSHKISYRLRPSHWKSCDRRMKMRLHSFWLRMSLRVARHKLRIIHWKIVQMSQWVVREPQILKRKTKQVRKKAQKRQVRKRKNSQSEPVVEESEIPRVPCTESTEIEQSSAESRKYICDQCNRGFQRPSRFLAHYRSVHLKQFERKICPYCPRSFTMSSSCKLE